jgi:GT2 family glycosyltransferase
MIAVIVLTYNSAEYLDALLASIAETVYEGTWTLIVVDNASTDETPRRLQKESAVTLIETGENLGYAGGMNVGIDAARTMNAEYVVLLNHDVIVDHHWLSELMTVAQADAQIGAVQARVMLEQSREKINSIGNHIHYLGFGFTGGNGQTFNEADGAVRDITYASGAAVLLRMKAIDAVGAFDPTYFMYHEDLDLGWRLWRGGWRVVLAPRAIVYHAFDFARSIKKYYWMERNRFRVLLENYSLESLILIAPAFVVMEIGMLPYGILSGWWKEKVRAYAWIVNPTHWQIIARARQKKQRAYRVPERDLLNRFVGTIDDQEVGNVALDRIANPIFSLYWNIVRKLLK